MAYPVDGVPKSNEGTLVDRVGQPGKIDVVGRVIALQFVPQAPGGHRRGTGTSVLVSLLGKRDGGAGRMLAGEGSNLKLAFRPTNVGQGNFIEVRHARPTKGTGDFQIAVNQTQGPVRRSNSASRAEPFARRAPAGPGRDSTPRPHRKERR